MFNSEIIGPISVSSLQRQNPGCFGSHSSQGHSKDSDSDVLENYRKLLLL